MKDEWKHSSSRGLPSTDLTEGFAPRHTAIAIALELGQCLVQNSLLVIGWACAGKQVIFLEFA